jgi:hypothetical protein
MAWLSAWMWAPGYGIFLAVLPLLFPTGRLPSRRWRPVAWLAGVALIGIIAPTAIVTWPVRGPRLLVDQPPADQVVRAGLATSGVMTVVLLGTAVAAAGSLVVRLRRAGSVERQQVKWFAYAAGLSVVVGAVSGLVSALTWLELLAVPCVIAGLTTAMFRYRLYDIDRIISRTLAYGLLSVVLGLGYAGGVLLGRQVLGGLTGTSSLAVAGSTLAMAALFQPLRRRIRDAVDRRFNRRRYDAAKTIQAFSARLREELDLDALSAELLWVVDQTMQPTTASLWAAATSYPGQAGATVTNDHRVRPGR